MTNAERIENELQLLGITKRYAGYRQSVLAIELALEDDSRLLKMTDEIYYVMAQRCSCGQTCIERNIRTVSRVAWTNNRSRLRQLVRYPIYAPLSASEFISILTAHLQRSPDALSV